jgi:hypothetical protein
MYSDQQDVINLYGGRTASSQPQEITNVFGTHQDGHVRSSGGGVTSLGVVSDNVWGNFADNAWGTSVDNVWGTTESNVWGGLGAGGLWGWKGVKVWGTGNGVNYLSKIVNGVAALFGLRLGRSERSKGGNAGLGSGRSTARFSSGGPRNAPRSSGRSR